MRKISEADVDGVLENLGFYSAQTATVLTERIEQPLPGHVVEIQIDRLDADPRQPRKQFTEETLRHLADSIRDQGVLQPILVRPAEGGRYLIVAGERRFRASRLAGRERVPCIVRPFNDEEALVIALVENIHRDDLTDMEKSDALVGIKTLTGQTWEALAERVRLTPARVQQLAGLQALAEPVKEQVRAGLLSGRKALVIRSLPPPEQITVAAEAAVRLWTAEELRQEVQKRTGKSPRGRKARSEDHITRYIVPPTTPDRAPDSVAVPIVLSRLGESLERALQLLRSTGGVVDAELGASLRAQIRELLAFIEPSAPE